MAKQYSVENVKVNNVKKTVEVTLVESSTFSIANVFSRPKKITKTLPTSVLRARSKSKQYYINANLRSRACSHQSYRGSLQPAYYYSGKPVNDLFGLGDIYIYLLISDYLNTHDPFLLEDFEEVAQYQEEAYDNLSTTEQENIIEQEENMSEIDPDAGSINESFDSSGSGEASHSYEPAYTPSYHEPSYSHSDSGYSHSHSSYESSSYDSGGSSYDSGGSSGGDCGGGGCGCD